MRRTLARITLTAAASLGLVATNGVLALGLGEIDVSSNLNQRFTASIPLTEISEEDLETVTVSLAGNDAFERAGIDRVEYLSSLDFEIKNDRGRPRVVITSGQIAREPVLNLLVQARWSGGKIVRDYTILLDPPEAASTVTAAKPAAVAPAAVKPAPVEISPAPAKPTAAPIVAAAPIAPTRASPPPVSEFYQTPAESKPSRKPPPAAKSASVAQDAAFDSATGSYGPVAKGETLWSIGTKVRPSPKISMDQVLLALAEANPVAIQRGTTVSKGTVLKVPSAERIQATSAAAAKARLAALRAGGQPEVVKAAAEPPKPAPEKPVAAVVAEPAKPTEAPKIPATTVVEPSKPAAPPASAPTASTAAAPVIATAPVTVSEPPKTEPASATPAAVAAATATTPATESTSAVSPPPAETAAATTATATAAPSAVETPAPSPAAPPKSPLAQPLPETTEPGFIESFGLPLGIGALVLLLALAGLALARRNKQAPASKTVTPASPAPTKSTVVSSGSAGALPKLGDTTRLSDTQTLGTGAAAATMLNADATQQLTQPLHSAPIPAKFAHDSTMVIEPAVAATLNSASKASILNIDKGNFDRTAQVHVETAHINLGDNDPLSEADFHLAYGLYDEAILLLKTTMQQQPQRTDIQVKLAETYFAAGRAIEFQDLAEDLKLKLSPGEWSKIAIMGSQICPDAELFQSSGGDAGLDADFDLAFDEPETPSALANTNPQTSASSTDSSVDFSLAPMEPASSGVSGIALNNDLNERPAQPPQPPAGMDDDASIDFMLGQSLTPLGADTRLPDGGFNLGSPAFNVQVPKLDGSGLKSSSDLDLSEFTDNPTLTPGGSPMSLSLQDLEVSITPRQSSASMDEEMNTKLDLARAYVEMGDNDMARSLLNEVQQQGNDRHQSEAASLLQRLPA